MGNEWGKREGIKGAMATGSEGIERLVGMHDDELPEELRHPKVGVGVVEAAWKNRSGILWTMELIDGIHGFREELRGTDVA